MGSRDRDEAAGPMAGSRRPPSGRQGVRRLAFIACALALPAADRCAVATRPESGGNVRIVLAVSGGIAGVDWQVTIDGREGRIVGDRCSDVIACDWRPGAVLASVGDDAVRELAIRFFEAEFFRGEAEHGTECCDQFDYVLTYSDPDDERTVTGSDGTLPERIRALIGEVTRFVEDARAG